MGDTNSKITEQNGRMVIITRNFGNRAEGCVLALFAIIGVILILGASGYIGLQVYEGTYVFSNLLIASLLLCFGLLAMLAVTTQRPKKTKATVTLDAKEEVLLYQQDGMDQAFMIGLGSASHLAFTHERRSNQNSSGNSSYTDVYAVFLILKDGTHFWLYEVTNKKDRAIELAVEIQQYLGMKLEDSQGIGASAEASRSYQRQEENHNFRASAQLKTQTVQGGTEYTFRKRPSFSHRFTLFLVAYFFTGIPTFILTMVMDNGGGFGLWFVIPILVIFVAILFLVYLVQARQYRVIAGPERLEIQVKFRNALVQARLGRTFILTREQIQAVRLNRLQHGNFWLSLSLSPGAALNRTSSLLVNMGAFGKNASLTTQDKYTTLGLWEIPLAANAKREPYLGDLLVVKDALERLYENE